MQPSDSDARRSSRLAGDKTSHLRDEVMRQIYEGYISRAASLASSLGLAPYCEATAQRLRNLWSCPPHRPSSAWTPPDAFTRVRIRADIEKFLRKSLKLPAKEVVHASAGGDLNIAFLFSGPPGTRGRHLCVWCPHLQYLAPERR